MVLATEAADFARGQFYKERSLGESLALTQTLLSNGGAAGFQNARPKKPTVRL